MDQQGGQGWNTGPQQPGWGDQPSQTPPGWADQPPPPGWGGQPPGWGPPQPARRLRPLTLGDVLDGMFRILFAHWRTFAIVLGLILVPLNLVTGILTVWAGLDTGLIEQFTNPAAAQASFEAGPELIPFLVLIAVTFLSAIFVNPLLNGVACRTGAEAFEGGNPQPREVLRATLDKYWTLLGVTVLVFLVGVGVFVVPGLLIAGGVLAEVEALAVIGGILAFIGVFVAIWLVFRLTLVYPVIVVERVGAVEAMRRSWRLVAGRWWRVFGTLLLAGIVIGIVSMIASMPFALPGAIFGTAVGVAASAIGSVIASIVTTPLTANAQTLLYFDGRIRSEGYDLEVMTRDVFGGGQDAPPPPGHGHPFG